MMFGFVKEKKGDENWQKDGGVARKGAIPQ